MSRTYCEFMNESSVFTGYCCSCNLVQIWCRDPIAMLMSMQHLGCWVLHEALTICLFSTWFSRTTWHQMYLDCLGLFRGCSNFAWMALQDKCERIVFGVLSASLDGCNLVVRCCGQFGESKNVYIISYVFICDIEWFFDGQWVFWGFSRWRPWTLRYGSISSFSSTEYQDFSPAAVPVKRSVP